MRLTTFIALLLTTFSVFARQQSAESRLDAQNLIFSQYWESYLQLNPTQATAVGDYRYNDKLGDNSLAGIAHRNEINAGYLARIKAISTEGFGEEERTSHDLFL